MQLAIGDTVMTRDRQLLAVTDVNNEDRIFVGYEVHPELFSDPQIGEPGYEPTLFVNSTDEVVSIIS